MMEFNLTAAFLAALTVIGAFGFSFVFIGILLEIDRRISSTWAMGFAIGFLVLLAFFLAGFSG